VAERGLFGPASADNVSDEANTRGRDRRRMMAEREKFLGD
jgi:hypothetical protein